MPAVRKLCASELSVTLPVRFRWKEQYPLPLDERLTWALGFYTYHLKRHVIYLDRANSPARANVTVIHELIHARQHEAQGWGYESDGTPIWKSFRDRYDNYAPLSESNRKIYHDEDYWRYYRSAAEVHARELASKLAKDFQVVKVIK